MIKIELEIQIYIDDIDIEIDILSCFLVVSNGRINIITDILSWKEVAAFQNMFLLNMSIIQI